MLDREIETLDNDPKRVFLGGFSQGSSLALDAGLSYDKPLGGIIVVGGFMSEMSKIENIKDNPDIIVVHGKQDELIKVEKAQKTMESVLERPNAKMVVIEDMAHDLYSEEAKKIIYDFIRERAKNE